MPPNFSFALQKIHTAFKQTRDSGIHSKFKGLYLAIKACIIEQEIPHNWLLPSTRDLSRELKLSRTTIIKAYELLMLEKLIESKIGSGYRVNHLNTELLETPTTTYEYPKLSEKGLSFLEHRTLLNRKENSYIAFKPGVPPIDIFPIKQWKGLLNNYWKYAKSTDLSFTQSTDSQLLKRQICNFLYVSRGIKCDPDQLLIVSGSLQSVYLIANAILNKGDSVVLEDPTFPNVLSLFKSSLAHVVPVPVNKEGIDMDELTEKNPGNVKLIHVTPTNHYPLGVKMSLTRRRELVRWAAENRSYIIENDYEHEIGNRVNPLPPIFNLDSEDRTLYLGTFNRLLYPSIRLGFMILPKHLVGVVEAIQSHSHRIVSHSMQAVMAQFIEKNWLFKHLKNLDNAANERYDVFIREFPCNHAQIPNPHSRVSSLHLIAYFKQEVSPTLEQVMIEELERNGISAYSLSQCYIEQPQKTGLILGYATITPVAIKQKMPLLSKVLQRLEFPESTI